MGKYSTFALGASEDSGDDEEFEVFDVVGFIGTPRSFVDLRGIIVPCV